VTKVYICKIPGILPRDIVYPPLRQQEIDRQRSEEKKLEKYWSWKLLEHAVKNETTYDFGALDFRKQENGRWECPNFHFSISHSAGYAAVVISDTECGIDLEKHRKLISGIEKKILTAGELKDFAKLSGEEEKSHFLIRKWTEKEAIFKSLGKSALMPTAIENEEFSVINRDYKLGEELFCLAVCGVGSEKCEISILEGLS
jgi:phosphopantetheinyl transferase